MAAPRPPNDFFTKRKRSNKINLLKDDNNWRVGRFQPFLSQVIETILDSLSN